MIPLKIVIIDDHKLIRDTWSFILNTDSRFKVIASSGSAEEGIALCKELRPDIVLLDINLPGMNGIEALPQIRKLTPATKIIGVSLHTQPSYAKRMMQAGALGYITKTSSRKEMTLALIQVSEGKKYICDEIKNIISQTILQEGYEPQNLNALSVREMEIVRFVKQGLSSKEIARELFISKKTVEVHRYNIFKKLNLKNAPELVNYANRFDIVK